MKLPVVVHSGWIALVIAGVSLAPAFAEFTAVPGAGFVERAKAQRAISGGTVVGVTMINTKGNKGRKHLWVRPNRDFNGSVRINAISDDGMYEGRGEFSGSAPGGKWSNVLNLPSKGGAANIRNGRKDPLFASLAESGRSTTNSIMITAWTNTPVPPIAGEVAVAFQNLAIGARVSVLLPGGQWRNCVTGLGKGVSAGYNTVCRLSISELEQSSMIVLQVRQGSDVTQIQRRLL